MSDSTSFENSQTDSDSNKCRLVIKVPKFDGTGALGTDKSTSYLRLGSTPGGDVGAEPGDSLLTNSTQTNVDPTNLFIDDSRDRDGTGSTGDNSGQNATTNTISVRQAESGKIFTKGGWRDHSDGNRISTTYGDKIEVIRGNYRLLVLGRQDTPGNGDILDISGGHTVDANAAPGSITQIKWVTDNWGGTWMVTEETQNGDTKSVFHGNTEEHFYGNRVTSVVGSATPGQDVSGWVQAPGTAVQQCNPTVTEHTWAQSITSNTGSSAWWVPSISETTYVTTETSEKHVHMTSEKVVADISLGQSEIGFSAEHTECGLKVESYVGPVIEAYAGIKLELELAAKLSISGPVSIELTFGLNVGLHNMKDELEVAKTEITAATDTKIANVSTAMAAAVTKLANVETKLATAQTELSQAKTKITNVHSGLMSLKNVLADAYVIL